MRISDWSSDVCSSDLVARSHPEADFEGPSAHLPREPDELGACENLEQAPRLLQRQKAKRIADEGRHAARLAAQAIEEQVEDQQPEKSLGFAAAGREIEEARREQIGRASCRERV